MAFMGHEVTRQMEWYEVDGPHGTEWIPADVIGVWPIVRAHFARRHRKLTASDCPICTVEEAETSSPAAVPAFLSDYCENRKAWTVSLTRGYGARLSAPGYLDCTEWNVFNTEQAAVDYLDEYYPEDEDEDEDESENENV